MIDRKIGWFIRNYSEVFLYLLLLASLLSRKVFGLPDLSAFVLLSPLIFLDDPFKWKNKWNLSVITFPATLLTSIDLYNLLNMTLSAFAEELFFRGYLMRRYSNIVVSFMFTIPHLLLYQNLQSALTFFPSLIYGVAYQKTQSLIFVSLLHLYSNLIYNYI
ncbi:CPBP family intramembrane glutamic endopeptidase [Hydrogenobacter hydrogenophilus]|uniref:CAAX prenyl protease 2/Lysostaphin resistance protein A-like domain-containing protein n=1 Tax=Hydrogenobacter hydrogenophilus TaxID=35835 RepID=A0A285NZV2_9AQUI|nr:CPBP family intramembrane glutamic endopeptidase [Hydrogenobacter hydrogenophilus]SNZ13436.1 hypothetical protein SAMN06265353_0757 [Hydrogenobacter hydrogenophilus]